MLNTPFHAITEKDLVEYGHILLANNFESWLKNQPNTTRKRNMIELDKYKNIIIPALNAAKHTLATGQGMYYTFSSPTFYRQKKKAAGRGIKKSVPRPKRISTKTNIEFFPSNKKVLLKKLFYLLGEYHCGNNTALRNEIIPIVQYLKSQNALPAKFNTKYLYELDI